MSSPISGFTAIPNPQMLAFMAAQSFVMMMQAGEGWQYGKRKQSAMTNEEFNKQTPLSIMQRQMSELKRAIPSIQQNMNDMTPMVRTIVEQYGDFAKEIIKATPKAVTNALGTDSFGALTGQSSLSLSPDISKGNIEFIKQDLQNSQQNFNDISNAISNFFNSFALIPQAHASSTTTHPTTGQEIIQGPTEGPPEKPPLITAIEDADENIKQSEIKKEAIQKAISEVQVVDNSPTNPNGVKTVIFTYYPAIKDPQPPHRAIIGDHKKKQVYKFDYNGHNRKYKQIIVNIKRSPTTNMISSATAKRLLIAYSQALNKAYPGKSFG